MSVPRNTSNVTWGVGESASGYCVLHDRDYPLDQGDEVCPQCLDNKERDLARRDEDNTFTDVPGDCDEE